MRSQEELARARAIVAMIFAACAAEGRPPDEASPILWVLEWAMGDDTNGFADFIAGEERVIAETTAQFARHFQN